MTAPQAKLFYWLSVLFTALLFISPETVAQSDLETERVWNIKIEGNQTFDGLVIKNIILNEPPTPFQKMLFWKKSGMILNENEVRRDVIRIERFYQRRGFDDVLVSYRIEDLNREWRKSLVFEIVENAPIKITTVGFRVLSSKVDSSLIFNDENFNSVRQNLPFKEGDRYETVNQTEFEGRLVGALRNLGYPYARSEIQADVDSTSKTASMVVATYPGPRARFDSVIVEGSENFAPKYVVRESGIQKGDYFSEDQLREAQREIFNHHMLRFAIVSIPDQPLDTLININIRVREAPLRSIQLRYGAGNFSRIEDGWADFYKIFRGQATWTHRNVSERGDRFTASVRASAIEQRIGVDYLIPYLFNTKSSLIISPFFDHKLEPSYEIARAGIINSFIYQYSSNFTGTISYEFTANNESAVNSQSSLPDSIQAYNVSSFSANAFYSKNLRSGRQGWSLQPFWELSGLFGESTFSFQETGVDGRKFTSLTDNIVFAKRVNLAGIYYSKQDSLPADIRIYSGGTNSVRGWNRQELGPKRALFDEDGVFEKYVPIGGHAAFSFNAELRFQLNQLINGFGVATFLDGGQVWRNFKDIGTTQIQYGLGGGLRYQSPIGPIRIDLAYKLNPTDEDLQIYQGQNFGSAWDRWGIHFSIGQAF